MRPAPSLAPEGVEKERREGFLPTVREANLVLPPSSPPLSDHVYGLFGRRSQKSFSEREENRRERGEGDRGSQPTTDRSGKGRGMHIWLKILPLLGEKGEKVGFRIDGDVCEEQIGSGRKKGKEGTVVE